jgi:hypothetical protein
MTSYLDPQQHERLKIAVVTPYRDESIEVINRCRESVRTQDLKADHYQIDHWLISDGSASAFDTHDCEIHVKLPKANNDYGNTPRGIGAVLASNTGDYEYLTFLDADNWIERSHIRLAIEGNLHQNSEVTAFKRKFYTKDGRYLPNVRELDEDHRTHVDTNCLFIHRRAFSCLNFWMRIPREISIVGDRLFFANLRRMGLAIHFSNLDTVCYSTDWVSHLKMAGHEVPENAKVMDLGFINWLQDPENRQKTISCIGFFPNFFRE